MRLTASLYSNVIIIIIILTMNNAVKASTVKVHIYIYNSLKFQIKFNRIQFNYRNPITCNMINFFKL